ncbi:hypothetical protein H5410_012584, partial [Solanum commersonii]
YEGTSNGDGKGPSIWDSFTHKHPVAPLHQVWGKRKLGLFLCSSVSLKISVLEVYLRRCYLEEWTQEVLIVFCTVSSLGDKEGVMQELEKGVEPNLVDYDKRTTFHLTQSKFQFLVRLYIFYLKSK